MPGSEMIRSVTPSWDNLSAEQRVLLRLHLIRLFGKLRNPWIDRERESNYQRPILFVLVEYKHHDDSVGQRNDGHVSAAAV